MMMMIVVNEVFIKTTYKTGLFASLDEPSLR